MRLAFMLTERLQGTKASNLGSNHKTLPLSTCTIPFLTSLQNLVNNRLVYRAQFLLKRRACFFMFWHACLINNSWKLTTLKFQTFDLKYCLKNKIVLFYLKNMKFFAPFPTYHLKAGFQACFKQKFHFLQFAQA